MLTRWMIWTLLCCCGMCTTVAQTPYFKNIPYDKEKRNARLHKIFQDQKGYLWLGSNFGICRYDGLRFNYLEKDSNLVTCITEDQQGTLWLGHENGHIETVTNLTVKPFNLTRNFPTVTITDMAFDAQQRLWVSTYGEGLYCYYQQQLYHCATTEGLTDNNIYDLQIQPNGEVWVGTDRGISICVFQKGISVIKNISSTQGLPDNIVRCFTTDQQGNTWVGMQEKGICSINQKTYALQIPDNTSNWNFGQVNSILLLDHDTLIGTEQNGLVELHQGLPAINKTITVSNSIQQLMQDNHKMIWMLANNQLSISNANHFQSIAIPEQWQDAIKAITTNASGKIWFANKKGLFQKENSNAPVEQLTLPTPIDLAVIVSLYADDRQNLWIGTYNKGLYQYQLNNHRLQHYTQKEGLADDNVFAITGKGTDLWLGTLGGAVNSKTDSQPLKFFNYTSSNGLGNNYVYQLLIDNHNNKWFATDGSGISRLGKDGFINYNNIPGLEKNIVYSITSDEDGTIWFTGPNSGLFSFDGLNFKRYTALNGLYDNDILNIQADHAGHLLLAHPNGIELFNINRKQFTWYGSESGFDNINPQINACTTTPSGSILIGSHDKIVWYYPADSNWTALPNLVMNKISVFFKPVPWQQQTEYTYDQNQFTFDYTGLWYLNPESVNYQYQLTGYNNEWVTTKDHVVTFSNLAPGNYVFTVKASINEDFRFAQSIGYAFTIHPPFWKKGWFIVLALLVGGGLLYYFVQLRIKMIRLQQEKEKQLLNSQLMVLKNQLNPHFLFNSFNTLMNIIDKDKDLAIEFAEKIADFYREIALVQDKEIITVTEELNLLNHYIYLQQKRFGEALQFQCYLQNDHLSAGIPPLTLQLLAENALKHNRISPHHPLTIQIESSQSYLIVSNNINHQESMAKSAGIGLNNIRERIQLLTGQTIQVMHSEKEFNVIIPLKL